jgi:hypothetical protein
LTRLGNEEASVRTRAHWAALLVAILAITACRSERAVVAVHASSVTWKTVPFGVVVFEVPSSWPVYQLALDPTRCVRFDQHAVYLGKEGPSPQCPARLLGRSEAVQIQTLDDAVQQQLLTTTSTELINGEVAAIQPADSVTHMIIASFPNIGVSVSASYLTDASLAERIVHSVRRG